MKVRVWLYGVYFILETDVRVFIAQLNRSGADLFSILVIRWLAWIRLFNFKVRYVPGTKYIIIDGLSRRPRIKFDNTDEEYIENINDFITTVVGWLVAAPLFFTLFLMPRDQHTQTPTYQNTREHSFEQSLQQNNRAVALSVQSAGSSQQVRIQAFSHPVIIIIIILLPIEKHMQSKTMMLYPPCYQFL